MVGETGEAHLVLGGSSGIGLAYARYLAQTGDALVLVGRSSNRLAKAREELLSSGARMVEVHEGNLLDPTFRSSLLQRYEKAGFASIFVGGPSPQAGQWRDLLPEDFAQASEVILVYPIAIMKWALGSPLRTKGNLILLSSSASTEPLQEHSFFLSGLLRRALEQVADCFSCDFTAGQKSLEIWRPRLVFTPLAAKFTVQDLGNVEVSRLREFLEKCIGEPLTDPDTYVKQMFQRLAER